MASPSVWNSLLDNLRDLAVGRDSFKHTLKTFLFTKYRTNATARAQGPDFQKILGQT